MKYVKTLGLAAIAAMALMAFLGTAGASATVIECETQPPKAGCEIVLSIKIGGSASLVNTSNEELDTCTSSTVKGVVTNAGSSTTTATGSVEELTWGSCTFSTKTITAGKLEVHHISGSENGTVTADGTFEITINTVFFGSCIYGVTSGTDIGVLTAGAPGSFDANAVAEKFSGSAFACPSTSKWTATYGVTKPKHIQITLG